MNRRELLFASAALTLPALARAPRIVEASPRVFRSRTENCAPAELTDLFVAVRDGWRCVNDRPWLGVGEGRLKLVDAQFERRGRQRHWSLSFGYESSHDVHAWDDSLNDFVLVRRAERFDFRPIASHICDVTMETQSRVVHGCPYVCYDVLCFAVKIAEAI